MMRSASSTAGPYRPRPDVYTVQADGLRGVEIALSFPSVTATENLLLAATLARGRTFIRNAAIEPEVVDLVMCLQSHQGADRFARRAHHGA